MTATNTPTDTAMPKGMTLRDYFAAHALAGVGNEVMAKDNMDLAFWNDSKEIARRCYQVADAMMEARKRARR